MNLELVKNTDPVLKQLAEPFDFENPQYDPEELAIALVDCMTRNGGIGLAAPQVGISLRVFAMASDPAFVCFNPKIVMPSEETVLLDEACLSFPGLVIKIKRPKHVRFRFNGPDGETYTKTFTGMTARCVYHEVDHLDGRTFDTLANKIHLDVAKKKLIINNRKLII